MAQYLVAHACGHSETVVLYGPHKRRTSRIEWMEDNGQCSACWLENRDIANQRAAEANTRAGLPELEGSPKQIAWAESIRAHALGSTDNTIEVDKHLRRCAEHPAVRPEEAREIAERTEAARIQLEAEHSAAWWIDNRYDVDRHIYLAYATAARDVLVKGIPEQERSQ